MGNPKQKWTAEEEEALRAGVAKYGAGKWKLIKGDSEFNTLLDHRSNIDLKDKWRNLSVANGQGPRDKSRTPKAKGNPADTPATPLPIAFTPASSHASANVVMLDSSRSLPGGNNDPMYVAMIFEALSTLNGSNGLETSAIENYIKQRLEVPCNFKKQLSLTLRRLVLQGKIEKVRNCYRIKVDVQPQVDMKTLTTTVHSIGYAGDTMEEAAVCAAYKIVEAENKSFVAEGSVREAERVSMMAEEMESLLEFAMDCYDQSARGDILVLV